MSSRNVLALLIVATILCYHASARVFPVPLQFPSGGAAPTFPLVCEWLQRISMQLDPNETSVETGREAVLSAVTSFEMDQWASLQVDSIVEPVLQNITRSQCEFDASMKPLQWHG